MPATESRKTQHLAPRVAAFALVSALGTATAVPASAAAEDFEFVLPAGLACAGFDLLVQGTGDNRIMKEFTDQNGDIVRTLAAGNGFDLTFTNLDNDNVLALPSNGSVQRTTINDDGTTTFVITGHNVLILFPTDIPAGPSTTLYVGRLVYTVDPSGVFTLQSTGSGTRQTSARSSHKRRNRRHHLQRRLSRQGHTQSPGATNIECARFKELIDKRLRRGRFTSIAELTDAITTWAEHWNHDPKPFIWKATADEIIAKVQRGRDTLHQIKSTT